METKSQGHLEMVLSMVFFVGFLLVIFLFFNPFKTDNYPSLERANKRIISNMTESIGKLSVVAGLVNPSDVTQGYSCYFLGENDFNLLNRYGNYFVGIPGPVVNSKKGYTVYFSDYFNPNQNKGCSGEIVVRGGYKFGLYKEEEFITERAVKSLKELYSSDYESLKKHFGGDFIFEFKENNVKDISLSVSTNAPIGVNVYSWSTPVRVIDNNANIRDMILTLRLW